MHDAIFFKRRGNYNIYHKNAKKKIEFSSPQGSMIELDNEKFPSGNRRKYVQNKY
jgi:hypothetical protein